jgi:hypothetical protein
MTVTNPPTGAMKTDGRAWDELRAAGGELSERHDDIDNKEIIELVNRVARQFEVPRSPEAEAVNIFLAGLLDAIGEAA